MTYDYGSMHNVPMTGMSGMAGGMNMMSNSGNIQRYFKQTYGCEDCFRKEPYMQEYPKPIMPVAKESMQSSWFKRILERIMG